MGGGTQTVREVQKNEVPKWMETYMKDALGRSQKLSRAQYKPFEGGTVAGFTPMQRQARRGIQQLASAGERPEFGQGLRALQQANRSMRNVPQWSEDSYRQYASPYFKDVVDIQKREAARDAALRSKQLRSDAISAGAFGGDREAIMQASLNRDMLQNLSDIEARGRQQAWEQAVNMFQSDRSASMQGAQGQMEAANQFLNFAQKGQDEAFERLGNLYTAGQDEQKLREQAIQLARAEHQAEQNWARDILGVHAGVVRGIPTMPLGTARTTGTRPGVDQTGQIIGGVLGLAGSALSLSDVRMKENIHAVGQSDSGVPTYTFTYKNDKTKKTYHGAMAQDLLHLNPEAVLVSSNGTYLVDYKKTDVDFYEVTKSGE